MIKIEESLKKEILTLLMFCVVDFTKLKISETKAN